MPRLRRPLSPVHLLRQVAAVALLAFALVLALRPAPAPAGARAGSDRPGGRRGRRPPRRHGARRADLTVARLPPGRADRPAPWPSRPARRPGARRRGPRRRAGHRRPAGRRRPDRAAARPARWRPRCGWPTSRSPRWCAAGDRIDVLATLDGSATAEVVARRGARAGRGRPGARDGRPGPPGCCWSPSTPDTAARLAAAATTATLTVTLPPP